MLEGPASFKCCAIAPDNRTIVACDSAGAMHFIKLHGLETASNPGRS